MRIQWGYSKDIVEYSRDTMGIQCGYSGDTVRIQ